MANLKLHIVFDDGYTVMYDVSEDVNNIPYYGWLESEDGLFLYEYGEPLNGATLELKREFFAQEDDVQMFCDELIKDFVKLRKEKGLTQHQLAAISGVKQPAIARLEKGDCVPKTDTITKLLSAMGKRLAFVDI